MIAFGISRWIAVCTGAFAVVAMVACEGGGHEPETVTHAPSISSMSYAPATTLQAAGGQVGVEATVLFKDVGADVSAMRVTSTTGLDLTLPLPTLGGLASGTGSAQFSLPVDKVGPLNFEVWLVDRLGSASNRLAGTVDVTAPPAPPPDHPPLLSGLTYSPITATQAAGTRVTLDASVSFADAGGDVALLRVASSAGTDLSLPTPALGGSKNGSASARFELPLDQAGRISFEVWAIDGRGSSSNRVAGSVDVVAAPAPPPAHAPIISGLTYSPTTATQAAGGTATVNLGLSFTDKGGDVRVMWILLNGTLSAQVPMPSLGGIQSGTAAASFTLPLDVVGRTQIGVQLVDAAGSASSALFGGFEVTAVGAPQDNWVTIATAAHGILRGVTWDGTRYAAVGDEGTVMTATDLNGWTLRSAGVPHTLRSVVGSPTRLVAVGDDPAGEAVVVSSSDGVVWSVQHRAGGCVMGSCATPAQLSKVIWTGTRFIAVGQERVVSAGKLYALFLTSPDGLTWTQRAPRAIELGYAEFPNERDMTSIAWSGSVYVATGLGTTLDPVVWVSSDADTWTLYDPPPAEAVALGAWTDIVWDHGRFVAVGGTPGSGVGTPVFTSTDGRTWTAQMSGGRLEPMRAIAASPGGYVAVGDAHREQSANGVDWTVTPTSGCGNAVAWDGTRFVAVGARICRSP